MRRIIIYCFILVMTVSLVDCGNSKKEKKGNVTQMSESVENDNSVGDIADGELEKDIEEFVENDNSVEDLAQKYREYFVLPGEFEVVKTNELVDYFNKLQDLGFCMCDRNGDGEEINRAIVELEKYAKGNRKYYPEEDIRAAISIMNDCEGYFYNHGPAPVINECSVFMYRFMEQAARLCPDIEFLADFCSKDKQIGIINQREWSPNPLLSMLIYNTNTDEGCRIRMIGEPEEVIIDKVFCLSDDKGNKYYLCSNNITDIHFAQFLFQMKDDDVELLCHTMEMPKCETYYSNSEIIFNPKKLCWERCVKKGKYYHRIDGTPSLRLEIDGKKSRFIVEEF